MKVATGRADSFARAPDPRVRAVLVYGPDAGLVRERVEAIVKSVVPDPADPFRVSELSAVQLREDPSRLGDEAAALALTGGRRVVRIDGAGDEVAGLCTDFLARPPGDALVVLLAGDLAKRSTLRKVFESAELGAALACYRDDERSLSAIIREMLGAQGLSATSEALDYLSTRLGGDRQVTRREVEKLILYKGTSGGTVEVEDALACVGDSAASTLEDLAYAVGSGDRAGLERALMRSLDSGGNAVAALRAVARHFQQVHFAAGMLSSGSTIADAVKRVRPPVFWKRQDGFKAQCAVWSIRKLARALDRLLAAELECKTTGAPAEAIAARALLDIAANAPRGSTARPGRH